MLITYLYRKFRSRPSASPSSTSSKPSKDSCPHQHRPANSTGSASSQRDGLLPQADGQPQRSNGKCPICQSEARAATVYRWKLIGGLMFPFALQALDVTIIASALPWIATDFGEVSQLNWIISAFNLTSAAFIPFWGQLADIFGRHYSLQVCIIIMMIGSALCTGAPTDAFPVLLLGRGFQGLGCAGISVIIRVILSDKVTLKENAKNWSTFQFVGGISYGVGPVIGGYLTKTNWRWCFGINLPIAAASIVLIFLLLRKELLGPQPLPQLDETAQSGHLARFSTRLSTIDIGGQILFLFGFGLVILAFTWGGATYDWNDVHVLAPLCIGAVLCVAFVVYEKLMAPGEYLNRKWPHQQSMLPWKLIVSKDIGLLFYINFATGAAMYSVLYFVDLYFTTVKGYTADKAGVQILLYTPGLGVGVYLSMFLCNVWPRKTWWPLMLGSVIEAVGVGVLAWALYNGQSSVIFGMMSLTGCGTGLRFMPAVLHGVGLFPKHIATVVYLMAVALPFGGTVALTVMSTVFNNTSGIKKDSPLLDFNTLHDTPQAELDHILQQAKMGIVWAFVAITPFMVLCMIAAAGLGNIDITKAKTDDNDEDYGKNVDRGVYLLKLLGLRRKHESGDMEMVDKVVG